MSQTIAEQESTIKESLFQFVKRYIPNADLNLIDEIVLSYVIAILEEASSDPVFDVEGKNCNLICVISKNLNNLPFKVSVK